MEASLPASRSPLADGIKARGFTLVNAVDERRPDLPITYTVGLQEIHNLPELIFVGESQEVVLQIIDEAITNAQLGLSLQQTVNITTIGKDRLTIVDVADHHRAVITPEIQEFYRQHPRHRDYQLCWVGRAHKRCPFERSKTSGRLN